MNFEVFWNVMKHSLECLIYYVANLKLHSEVFNLPDDFFRVAVVNGVDVLTERWIPLCIDLLYFPQPSTCHKQPTCRHVVWENLGELADYMFQDVRRRVLQKGF